MLLEELLEDSDPTWLLGDGKAEVLEIAMDSGCVTRGSVFFCVPGNRHDGNDYWEEAFSKGAIALVADHDGESLLKKLKKRAGEKEGITLALVKNVRSALAGAAIRWFGRPADELITIGVTGTKGKTTCTYLIKSILENAGRKVGLIGTNEIIIGRKHLEAGNTTPDALSLHSFFRRMADAGADTVVMEVSSQAIKQKRTEGILFDYGIFTNLSPDHVGPGEHADFQEYLECKRELFRQCRIGIVNGDDPYAGRVTEGHLCRMETYGMGETCTLRAKDVTPSFQNGKPGVSFQVAGDAAFPVTIPMPGMFSVYNALAAISLCRHFRVRESDVQRSMLAAKVKGRMELVLSRGGSYVYVDYAHNPMALASLLDTLREYHPGRLICLFGCGGDRPVMRRRLMGRVSGERADLTVITDDNPRSEDPALIREQIAEGVKESGGAYLVIAGRRDAIRYVLQGAKRGDFIVLAGKGHETYQEIGGEKHPMDEREIVREILSETCNMQTS